MFRFISIFIVIGFLTHVAFGGSVVIGGIIEPTKSSMILQPTESTEGIIQENFVHKNMNIDSPQKKNFEDMSECLENSGEF